MKYIERHQDFALVVTRCISFIAHNSHHFVKICTVHYLYRALNIGINKIYLYFLLVENSTRPDPTVNNFNPTRQEPDFFEPDPNPTILNPTRPALSGRVQVGFGSGCRALFCTLQYIMSKFQYTVLHKLNVLKCNEQNFVFRFETGRVVFRNHLEFELI